MTFVPYRDKRTGTMAYRKLASILLIGAMLGVAGCNSKKEEVGFTVDNIVPPDRLYNQALANMEAGDLKTARDRIKDLNAQHPYSEYSRRSLILDTFINYRQGSYTDAASSGSRFLTLYPGDKDAAYAQYIVGMSYYKQIPHITRDQSTTRKAYQAMSALVEKYPESEYVEDAKTKMRITRDQLAGKEMLVGRYYQERREFLAAINRFRRVVETYPNTRHVEEALARLTESYYSVGLAAEAQNAAAVLGHNFPDSQWYRDSYQLLQTGGLRPQQSPSSWLQGLVLPKQT